MRNQRTLSLALLLAAALSSPAAADQPAPPTPIADYEIVGVAVTASSARPGAGPENAVDRDLASAWCPAPPGGTGETLTVAIAQPVPIDRLVVDVGVRDDHGVLHHRPRAITMALDDGAAVTSTGDNGFDWIAFKVPGTQPKKITLRIADPSDPTGQSCIRGLHLERAHHEHSLLRRPEAAAVAALRPAIGRVAAAVDSCDAAALREVAAFPVAWSEMVAGGSRQHRTRRRTARRLRNAAELAKACQRARSFGGLHDQRVEEVAADRVNVIGGSGPWGLAWKKGAWRLTALPDGQ